MIQSPRVTLLKTTRKYADFSSLAGSVYMVKNVFRSNHFRFFLLLMPFLNSGIKCNQLHSKPNKHMFTADEQEFFVDLPEEPLPSPGSIICVGVSCVNSPFSMYVVLPHGTRDLRYARAEIDEPETLETLQVKYLVRFRYNPTYLNLNSYCNLMIGLSSGGLFA